MPLTDPAVRNLKALDKPYKKADGGGLFLLVNPSGAKWWRLKFRVHGREKQLSLGTYPDTSLAHAREQREEARALLARGIDPGAHRKATKQGDAERLANSFEAIAREWFAAHGPKLAPAYAVKVIRRFERDLFPALGKVPVADLTAAQLLKALRGIEARGAVETAHRALGECGQVLRYAVATQRAERDISADLRGALKPVDGEHFAAVTDPKKVGELLRAIHGYSGSPVVCAALKLAPLFFVRPGELRRAEWAHIDLDAGEWRYFVTKTKSDHIVPLCRQAIEILVELHRLTGHGRYVFPSARGEGKPLSDNAILAALRRMGIGKDEMTGHGFRAMARTILDEVLNVRVDLIEHQLAHAVRDANGRAYNRTAHLPERRDMMQQWANYLERLRNATEPSG
ncbi:MAG: integrase arm-type DNA-binding domain-containing protein [Burkholderiales bacterium]|nr:integrase arm-type DNA-binding domain-containing protein [Burkholderiales bacterium]